MARSFFFVPPCVRLARRTYPRGKGGQHLAVRRLAGLRTEFALFGCSEIDFVGKLLEEDRSGHLTLCNPVRAARMDDGDVRDPDKSEDDAKVGCLGVVGFHGRT